MAIDTESGRKDDAAKPPWHLLPFGALGVVVDVLAYGSKKYAVGNWRLVESWKDRYLAATLRHLVAFEQGEILDPESGLPHLAHAACSVLFMLALSKDGR